MYLTTDPWIPVVWNGGKSGMLSLHDAFLHSHEIRDLAVRPHERIALMRLFICIAQAALDGPADYDDWKSCQSRIAPAARDYLKGWQSAFELFGNGQRFLQVSNLKKAARKSDKVDDEGNSVSKLDLMLATGNNSTLFDNAGGGERVFTPARLAIMLLTFQCFSPGGRIGVALWNGQETPGKGSSDHAPCLAGSMLHAIIRGDHLLHTLHANLLSKSQVAAMVGKERWGRPVWEWPPARFKDADPVGNATETYLGRLVPLSRAIRLDETSCTLVLANGLKFATYDAWREAMATVIVRKVKGQAERVLLRASLDKAPWRELHSLTVKAVSQTSNGGPLALQNISGDRPFDLWVGGLVADQAKLIDSVESVFHVPAGMLTDQRVYEAGVRLAQDMEFRLRRAVSVYHKELGNNLDRNEMREQRQRVQSKATFQYWTDAERRVSDLLAVVENPAALGLDMAWQKTDWGQAVWGAALAAFERACPHETARQIRAYALGRQALFATPAHRQTERETGS